MLFGNGVKNRFDMGAEKQKTEMFQLKKNYCWLTGFPVNYSEWNRDREAEYIRKKNKQNKKEDGKVQIETGG